MHASTNTFTSEKSIYCRGTRGYTVRQTAAYGPRGGFSSPLPNWALKIPRLQRGKYIHSAPTQCTPNQVGEGGSTGITESATESAMNVYCLESDCINARLHELHIAALETTDCSSRQQITREIDTFVIPCATLKRYGTERTRERTRAGCRVEFECLCGNKAHAIYLKHTHTSKTSASGTKACVKLPINCLFLLPQDEMNYDSLPDLGIFIRSTMTKKFYTSTALSHNNKMRKFFACGSKKGARNKNNTGAIAPKHWTETVSNSWCTSLLLETIPCLNRYKRGFKHLYDVESVGVNEVRAVIQILYGTLLKLYPRGSKTPIFSARVNLVKRIQELLEQEQSAQMLFVSTYGSLVKFCLMEYCYNLLLDYFPVEYDLVCRHPSMNMYEATAKVMFDAFRRDVITTGLETWDFMNSKATSSIERCMRICKFKMNKNIAEPNPPTTHPGKFGDPVWTMRSAFGDLSVLSRVYKDIDRIQLTAANLIHKNIITHALPLEWYNRQRDSLHEKFGACGYRLAAMRSVKSPSSSHESCYMHS
jgi:hypothetical protein